MKTERRKRLDKRNRKSALGHFLIAGGLVVALTAFFYFLAIQAMIIAGNRVCLTASPQYAQQLNCKE